MHAPIRVFLRGLIDMKGIAILHHKFARAHDTESRADFVAKLGLYLKKIHRQLLVAFDLAAGDLCDHLFMGGSEAKRPLVAVFKATEFRAIKLPST